MKYFLLLKGTKGHPVVKPLLSNSIKSLFEENLDLDGYINLDNKVLIELKSCGFREQIYSSGYRNLA